MEIGIVNGANWTVERGIFSLFDQRGYVSGKNWVVSSGLGSLLAEVDPAPVSGDMLAIIAQDELDGNADKIAYVGVHPRIALLLALEGVITTDTLRAATETPDRIICTVVLGGVERSLIVLKNTAITMATYDLNDEVV